MKTPLQEELGSSAPCNEAFPGHRAESGSNASPPAYPSSQRSRKTASHDVETIVDTVVTFVREHESWAAPIAFLVAFGESFCFFVAGVAGNRDPCRRRGTSRRKRRDSRQRDPAGHHRRGGSAARSAMPSPIGSASTSRTASTTSGPSARDPHLIEHGQNFFEQYGAFGVFLGHFFGPVRAVIPVVAGMFAMRQLPFQIANVASALIWAAGVIAPSFYLVAFKEPILAFLRDHEGVVALVLFALALANAVPRPLLFLPTLVLFILVGALHIFAGGSFLTIWLAGAAGAIVGDLYAFCLGQNYQGNLKGAWPWTADAASRRARASDREPGASRGCRQQVSRLQSRPRAADGGGDANGNRPVRRGEPRFRASLVGGAAAARYRRRLFSR